MRTVMFILAAMLVSQASAAPKVEVRVETDRTNAVYKVGETIRFGIALLEDGRPAAGRHLTYRITGDGGLEVTGACVSASAPVAVTTALDIPGWATIDVDLPGEGGRAAARGRIGVMADPHAIRPGGEELDDFDAFWKRQRLELDRVPITPRRFPPKFPSATAPISTASTSRSVSAARPTCRPAFSTQPAHPARSSQRTTTSPQGSPRPSPQNRAAATAPSTSRGIDAYARLRSVASRLLEGHRPGTSLLASNRLATGVERGGAVISNQ